MKEKCENYSYNFFVPTKVRGHSYNMWHFHGLFYTHPLCHATFGDIRWHCKCVTIYLTPFGCVFYISTLWDYYFLDTFGHFWSKQPVCSVAKLWLQTRIKQSYKLSLFKSMILTILFEWSLTTEGVNFINVKRTNFSYERLFGSFFYVHMYVHT